MSVEVMHPVGARLSGLDLTRPDADLVGRVRTVLADHGVAVIPGQDLDDEEFVAFLGAFGELVFSTGETPVPGFPDLNVISNQGRTTPPRSTFHVDTSYVARPPAYTALRTVLLPASGGETLFTDQYAAYETLPAEVRSRLAGRTMEHVVTGLDLGDDDEKAAHHPIFARHPVSGRTSLYLTTPARCAGISGLGPDEAQETIAFLYAHSTREDNTLRHVWSPGDVVMWDNRCVLHKADHSGVVGDRVMHRGMVTDGVRIPAAPAPV